MSTFVLVHGAWHGGWCYARVADRLRAQGHRVFTPTLTGLGERSHLADRCLINASIHIRDVINVIEWERLSDVVLCGHSYGGMIVTAVADALPERIASLVYLDAVIPESGKSMLEQLTASMAATFLKAVAERGNGLLLPPLPAAAFNVNPADRAMVDALCTPHPFLTYTECVHLTGAYLGVPKKTYVEATDWDWSGARERKAAMKATAGADWKMVEVVAGHDLMLDTPDEVARILLGAI
jgi:pimeloyl-ACP methyl ester carboxylesterase